jgi:integrase
MNAAVGRTNPDGTDLRHRRRAKRGNGEGTISKRADGRYCAAIFVTRPDGTRGRKWVYGKTRAEVAEKLAELANKVRGGAVLPTRSVKLADYLDYWLSSVAADKVRPTTYAKYEQTIRLYLKPNLGTRTLERLTVPVAQEFLSRQLAAGHSVPKVKVMREVLSSALSRAVREELIGRNVAQLTTLPTNHGRPLAAWKLDEAQCFLAAARADPLVNAFTLLLHLGMRRGELIGLRWEDLDTDAGLLRVRRTVVRVGGRLVVGPAKTRAGFRPLPLLSVVRRALDDQRARQHRQREKAGDIWAEQGYVFTTRTGCPIEPRNLARSFARIIETAGLRPIRLHDLRRTTATLLKSLKVPARDAMMILGHSRITQTLEIYSDVYEDEQREALRLLDQALTGGS